MLQINGQDIRLTRGDSAVIDIALTDADGQPYALQYGDRLIFGAKTGGYSRDYALYKELASPRLVLAPQDTAGLEFRRYVYDLELRLAGGNVNTVVSCAGLEIMEEVVTDG